MLDANTIHSRINQINGVTFQSLVNQTREALARHYLSQTTLSNGEISFLLGFEDPTSFFRAFHDWAGCTPDGLRHGTAN